MLNKLYVNSRLDNDNKLKFNFLFLRQKIILPMRSNFVKILNKNEKKIKVKYSQRFN